MRIKMRADDILLACNQFVEARRIQKTELCNLVDSDDILWHQIRENRDDKFFLSLFQMAQYAEQSEYPYISLNEKEFNKLRKYS